MVPGVKGKGGEEELLVKSYKVSVKQDGYVYRSAVTIL